MQRPHVVQEPSAIGEGDDRVVFEAVFRTAAIGIALVDMEGRPVVSNPALHRMLGYDGDRLAAMTFPEFTHPDDVEADWDLFQELIAGERDSYEMHKRYLHRDGHVVWGHLTVSLIRGGDGSPRYAVGMVEDVTDRKLLEDRYRTLVEQLPGIVYTAEFGEAGRWQYASPFATALLGFSAEEILQDPLLWWRQIHPDDRLRVMEEEQFAHGSGGLTSEYRMFTKSGGTVWVYDVARVIESGDGSTPHLHGVILDITARKEAEQRLAESESALRTIIESEPECVKQVSRDGTLLSMNPAGLSIVEAASATDVVGGCVYDLVAPEHRDAFRELTEATFTGSGGTLGFDIIGLRGTRRSMETQTAPLRDHRGRVTACLAVTRDVTDRKRTERELHDALGRAEALAASLSELNAAKSGMIQLLSHELFTPISVIQGVAFTLAHQHERIDQDQRRDLAAGVDRASRRLRRLVGNLSTATRLDSEGIPLEITRVRVEELLTMVTEEFSSERERLRLPSDANTLAATLSIDVDLAVRAMALVIENAMDLSDDEVVIDVDLEPPRVVLTVADRGPGIPEPARGSVFEAFVQADPGMTREHEGLGIGLYLARRIVEAHGGEIRAISRPGFGGVIRLSLPT